MDYQLFFPCFYGDLLLLGQYEMRYAGYQKHRSKEDSENSFCQTVARQH